MNTSEETSLESANKHRSHNLYVLSNAAPGQEKQFLSWFNGEYLRTISQQEKVLSAQHFERNELDPTEGLSKPFGYRYLGIFELCLDGAGQAEPIINQITAMHEEEVAAENSATWLYYPAGEKVGRSPKFEQFSLLIAFTNAIKGSEAEFSEWYSTRHIRHAFNIPAPVNGQCFKLTEFQRPGATAPGYETVAVYEMEGGPEDIIKAYETLPPGTLDFPALDEERFTEWVFSPISKHLDK